jgi:hypothetical protein
VDLNRDQRPQAGLTRSTLFWASLQVENKLKKSTLRAEPAKNFDTSITIFLIS